MYAWLEVNPRVNKQLYGFAFLSFSLCDLLGVFGFPKSPKSWGFGYPALLGTSTLHPRSGPSCWRAKREKRSRAVGVHPLF